MDTDNTIENSMPNFLVAPLDWGIGHATRCIPIIELIIQKGGTVIIAATGIHRKVLQQSFPNLKYIDIPNYNIQYGKSKWTTIVKLIQQSFGIEKKIKAENDWLQTIVEKEKIDIVIADNRYGLYHKKIKPIFITHQLKPRLPFLRMLENWVQKKLYKHINQFDECWVLDYKGENSIAKELSNPTRQPSIPTKYAGIISRLKKLEMEKIYDAAIVLSGPEPQRTFLENKIMEKVSDDKKMVLVRGTTRPLEKENKHIKTIDLASSEEINLIAAQSKYVISRSGYSSIMDWLSIEAKPIMIPTPGQTEQEYLAAQLFKNQISLCYTQQEFNLTQALEEAETFPFKKINIPNNQLADLINELIIK